MTNGWRVGIDIGGTFTDVVAVDVTSGEARAAKVATRTDDRVAGLLAALEAVDLDWDEVADLIHGTTMVTNAIVEDDLADVALIATEGFSDTLAIGRQNRRFLYRLDLPPKIAPLVPDERCFEVAERLDHEGRVLRALEPEAVEEAVRRVAESGVESVAVSLLHSYANPAHEEELGRRLRDKVPYVALSHRVNPEAREFERMATSVLSAGVMPLATGLLDSLEAAKPDGSRLHMFHSAGGMASPDALRDLPLGLAMSGPAAGAAAAARVAGELDLEHAISFDMGGTTTDVCLISGGRVEISSDRSLGARPLRQPMVAVESIGAGGGSIARLEHGALCVGPESAGADPGPACYGRGGTQPTVSDANLLLGYLDKNRVLGDGLRLDPVASQAALEPLAAAMEMAVSEAALGILRVANAAMVRALRRITVERGIDGRQCVLLGFGGAGPMHAVDVARAFGISRVMVPALSSVFSALGCVSAEMSYAQQRTVRMAVADWDVARLADIRADLHAGLEAPILAAGHDREDTVVEEVAAVSYSGQSYAIEIENPSFDDPGELGRAFLRLHEKLYGFATDEPWELVSIRQRVSLPGDGAGRAQEPETGGTARPFKTAPCIFPSVGEVATPRYDRAALPAGAPIAGPAVVEDAWSTVVVPPGAVLTRDTSGNLNIDAGAAP
ncbi:MAG: hydantoinase/oxoprolinase family protein [Kiloniellaceae bacterium]